MIKDLKILIIGFGSIGKRHYANLKKLGYTKIYLYDTNQELVKHEPLIFNSLNPKTLKEFDIVLVSSPNHLHIKHATLAAKAGCHLLIEKPLSHNLHGVDKLIKICQHKKLTNMVACNMRFHPALKFIKQYLQQKKLGKIYSIQHHFGHYLPYWRPGIDYTKNYAVKRHTGGGIILDDIHEFDLLFWFNDFAKVKNYKFIYDKISNLKIATEDICYASFKFTNKVFGHVSCNYLEQSYTRNCSIIGDKGTLSWDFSDNIVWLTNKQDRKKLFQLKRYDINQMYLDQMKYFIDSVNKKNKTFNDIKTAKQVLTYCLIK